MRLTCDNRNCINESHRRRRRTEAELKRSLCSCVCVLVLSVTFFSGGGRKEIDCSEYIWESGGTCGDGIKTKKKFPATDFCSHAREIFFAPERGILLLFPIAVTPGEAQVVSKKRTLAPEAETKDSASHQHANKPPETETEKIRGWWITSLLSLPRSFVSRSQSLPLFFLFLPLIN